VQNDDIQQIIDGCMANDAKCQRLLYDRYSPRFYALCRRYACDEMLAEDILTEGFLTIFRTIGQYRGDGNIEAWMRTIFVRTAIHHYRQQQRLPQQSMEEIPEKALLGDSGNEDSLDLRNTLQMALSHLDDGQRTLLNLIAVDGYQFNEVAQMLGTAESTVKSRYYSACQQMRKILGETTI
jgi:RNA polymerase sigma-70 factor (ECF subfamily)